MKIYLSRAMADAKDEGMYDHIYDLISILKVSDQDIEIFDPPVYYNYKERKHQTEKEVMRFELENVRNSDIVIYDEEGIKSTGAAIELAVAYEHRIPILVLNIKQIGLHPWIEHMSNRVFNNPIELVEYIKWYYLG